ncbi:MAG TPA: hypothetical protein DEG43_00645 [Acidimicrobiaceae bacterium]|nr:hypothetical protein [Acidimicrobiaceae bacterium]
MFGLRPWLAFLRRALIFFLFVRFDMAHTLPLDGENVKTGCAHESKERRNRLKSGGLSSFEERRCCVVGARPSA